MRILVVGVGDFLISFFSSLFSFLIFIFPLDSDRLFGIEGD